MQVRVAAVSRELPEIQLLHKISSDQILPFDHRVPICAARRHIAVCAHRPAHAQYIAFQKQEQGPPAVTHTVTHLPVLLSYLIGHVGVQAAPHHNRSGLSRHSPLIGEFPQRVDKIFPERIELADRLPAIAGGVDHNTVMADTGVLGMPVKNIHL